MEGLEDLTVEQAYELTDASAERSAAGAAIALERREGREFLKSNVALMEKMIAEGYQDAETLGRRIDACRNVAENPVLLKARSRTPSMPRSSRSTWPRSGSPSWPAPTTPTTSSPSPRSRATRIDEVFIGSCMTNIGHFRAAEPDLGQGRDPPGPALAHAADQDGRRPAQAGGHLLGLRRGRGQDGDPRLLPVHGQPGPGPAGTTVFSTSTRNFDDRIGDGARVYLGSAELAAVAALKGRIPTVEEYLSVMKEKVLPNAAEIYRYLEFHKMEDFSLGYAR